MLPRLRMKRLPTKSPRDADKGHYRMGPMLIGTVFNICLYGIMITQVHLYFHSFKTDKAWFKFLVLFLFLADTVNAVFDVVYVYDCLVIHFGEDQYLASANWVFATDPVMTGIIAVTVQFFFAWRVKVITNSKIATGVVLISSLASFCKYPRCYWYVIVADIFPRLVGAIGTSIAVGKIPVFTEFVKFEVIVIIWCGVDLNICISQTAEFSPRLAGAAITDVGITTAMTYHLQKHKTGFSATDDVVNRIIRRKYPLTAVVAIIDLVLFLTDTTGTHLIFNVPLSKLYTNSLMSSLNARGGWKFGGSGADTTSGAGDATKRTVNGVTIGSASRPEVFVHVEQHEQHELADFDDKQNSATLFPDADSDHGNPPAPWTKTRSLKTGENIV
ncbi:hypothetical protein HWV62_3801 [Athelia sp. TMB]|nr:hypothetical protein HWV62_3801 [Athelia sp. TMB]